MLYDLIVIGSGPAGQCAAVQGAKCGKKVAVIELSPEVGGGCIHSGTIPSKSFRESVYRWSLKSATKSATKSAPKSVAKSGRSKKLPEMKRLLERRDRVVRSEAEIIRDQLKRNGITVYQGKARILSTNDVEVTSKKGRERLTATFVFVATGARPEAPAHLRVDGKKIHDSDSILTLKKIPKTLVVLGAGIIGCEYGSIFATAGTKVYLVDRRHEILAAVDREIVAQLTERFAEQGVEVILEAHCKSIDKAGRVILSNGRKLAADAVLIAQGRVGNTDGLGLDEVGIERDPRGLIPVDKNFRTAVPNIYAVGDVIGPPALASTSLEQGRSACRHALGLDDEELPPLYPYGIYTIPEISMVGLTEEHLRDEKREYLVGRAHYQELARGQIVGDGFGFLKMLVCPETHRILGVHIIGDSAADLIHIGQTAMAFGGTANYFAHSVFNYPTFAEAYKTAALQIVNQSRQSRPSRSSPPSQAPR